MLFRSVGVRALVVALDPFQWVERRVYERFNELIDLFEPQIYQLSVCYRQSANVGLKALEYTSRILDETSPFILDAKIEEHKKSIDPLREICVEGVRFVDDSGRFRLYEESLDDSFEGEINRIRSRDDLWRHWHPLLIVHDSEDFPIPNKWRELTRGLNSVLKSIEDISSIRGCEYQEVILLVGIKTWNLISNGVLGATSADWKRAISFHTLMTRPKDSLAIFIGSQE